MKGLIMQVGLLYKAVPHSSVCVMVHPEHFTIQKNENLRNFLSLSGAILFDTLALAFNLVAGM